MTSGRLMSAGDALAGSASDWRCSSAAFRSKRRGGAPSQKTSLYAGAGLQKQVRQFVQTTVRSRVRQLHQSASAASKTTRQFAQMTSYRCGTASASGFLITARAAARRFAVLSPLMVERNCAFDFG